MQLYVDFFEVILKVHLFRKEYDRFLFLKFIHVQFTFKY
jgi:hypothetical protein